MPSNDREPRGEVPLILIERARRFVRRQRNRLRILARPAARDPALVVPFGFEPPPRGGARVAAVLHLFHPELAAELRDACAPIGAPCDLLITSDSRDKLDAIGETLSRWPHGSVRLRQVENRGRDIAPKLTGFADCYADYDLLLFLHSKKSEHEGIGHGWREKLLASLAGSEQVVRSILALFAADPALGIVFPQHHEPIRWHLNWGDNFADADRIARRMGVALAPRGTMEFVSGSMFWARPAALRPLLELGLRAEDFPVEAGQTDGTLAHAIERLFLVACELAGFSWCKVGAPEFYHERRTFIAVREPSELAAAAERTRFEVLKTMVRPEA